jgi:hypothetical protein
MSAEALKASSFIEGRLPLACKVRAALDLRDEAHIALSDDQTVSTVWIPDSENLYEAFAKIDNIASVVTSTSILVKQLPVVSFDNPSFRNVPRALFNDGSYHAFTVSDIPDIVWTITLAENHEDDDDDFSASLSVLLTNIDTSALVTLVAISKAVSQTIINLKHAVENTRRIGQAEKASTHAANAELRKTSAAAKEVSESYYLMYEYEKAKSLVLEKQVGVLKKALTQYSKDSWEESNPRLLAFDGPPGYTVADNALNHVVMQA